MVIRRFSGGSGLPQWRGGKEPACLRRRHKRHEVDPWVGKMPWRRAWQPTPVILPGESHGQRGLVGYSPWGHRELDTAERLSTHTCPQETMRSRKEIP